MEALICRILPTQSDKVRAITLGCAFEPVYRHSSMAIIAAKKCTREVSDKAACCPHCGVSIARAAQSVSAPRQAMLYWHVDCGRVGVGCSDHALVRDDPGLPKQLVGFIGSGSSLFRTAKAPDAEADRLPSSRLSNRAQAQAGRQRRLSDQCERLYQDYERQMKWPSKAKSAGSPIRVSGRCSGDQRDAQVTPS